MIHQPIELSAESGIVDERALNKALRDLLLELSNTVISPHTVRHLTNSVSKLQRTAAEENEEI